jgi:hypothetical protein
VQWEKTRAGFDVINLFNLLFGTTYVIPNELDQLTIILDGASLVKAPPPELPGLPCPVDAAVAYGFSASALPIAALKSRQPLAFCRMPLRRFSTGSCWIRYRRVSFRSPFRRPA